MIYVMKHLYLTYKMNKKNEMENIFIFQCLIFV